MFRLPIVLLLLASVGRLPAEDDEWKLTTGAGYASERIFRGVERSGGAAEASVEATDNGFRGGVWTSQPFQSGEPGETDLSAGYVFKRSGQFTLEAKATQFLFSKTAPGATKESTETGLEASWTSGDGVTARLGYFHDFRLEADTLQVGTGYSLPLKSLGAYLDLNSFVGWVNGFNLRPDSLGPRESDSYAYIGADAQLPYRVGAHATLVAGLHFTDTVGQGRRWSPILAPGGAHSWVSLAVNFDF